MADGASRDAVAAARRRARRSPAWRVPSSTARAARRPLGGEHRRERRARGCVVPGRERLAELDRQEPLRRSEHGAQASQLRLRAVPVAHGAQRVEAAERVEQLRPRGIARARGGVAPHEGRRVAHGVCEDRSARQGSPRTVDRRACAIEETLARAGDRVERVEDRRGRAAPLRLAAKLVEVTQRLDPRFVAPSPHPREYGVLDGRFPARGPHLEHALVGASGTLGARGGREVARGADRPAVHERQLGRRVGSRRDPPQASLRRALVARREIRRGAQQRLVAAVARAWIEPRHAEHARASPWSPPRAPTSAAACRRRPTRRSRRCRLPSPCRRAPRGAAFPAWP